MKDLADTLKAKTEDRERFYALQKWLHERRDDVLQAPSYVMTEFWCNTCKKDFDGSGFKQVRVPPQGAWFAYYVGRCTQGHQALRYITDKLLDPYFRRSKRIKIQQGRYSDEMLQPWQPRFRQIYPQQYAKLYLNEQGIDIN